MCPRRAQLVSQIGAAILPLCNYGITCEHVHACHLYRSRNFPTRPARGRRPRERPNPYLTQRGDGAIPSLVRTHEESASVHRSVISGEFWA